MELIGVPHRSRSRTRDEGRNVDYVNRADANKSIPMPNFAFARCIWNSGH